jgi:hypothetical protein
MRPKLIFMVADDLGFAGLGFTQGCANSPWARPPASR